MLDKIEVHYWHRQPAIDQALARRFADFLGPGKLVVDVGAGYSPWPHATECVDFKDWGTAEQVPLRHVDLDREPLPYADKSVDFVYCRHTLEDIQNPDWVCQEINRVAKAGYIETPSPVAEFCRGVDDGQHRYRGYQHHRYFAWVDDGVLTFVPKYPLIEHIDLGEKNENELVGLLNRSAVAWNTYFPWTGELKYRMLRHGKDFHVGDELGRMLLRAMPQSTELANKFLAEFGLEGTQFVGQRSPSH
jgi:hypothetical protein